ncbi:hypothetical protein [Ralstonia sp.]|uniref:hypothetical protein n=1 Tax=Ralstonia sp. TaxID=54061 RepID=UPI00257A5970|nr:hypothetical protein [Ralstonia sp.]MBA4203121.1 hypothetical protein [Ralstonia sp.]MBA4282431.1 hypothetical protein [Ralstonia sp.]
MVRKASTEDIVQDILAAVAQDVPAKKLAEIEARIRDAWGGCNVWIGKNRGESRHEKAAAIRRDYAAGLAVGALCRVHGVSRATVYRAIGVSAPP